MGDLMQHAVYVSDGDGNRISDHEREKASAERPC